MTHITPILVPLEGATNVRDLGGYATRDGGRVRTGLVFRSASLAGMTPRDVAALDALGLRTICDLRGVRERERALAPLDAVPHVTVHPLPIEPTVGASLRDIAATREATGEDVMSIMRRAYVAYVRDFPDRYRTIFAYAADPSTQAVLFHCSAGKDRTGFGAALLLTALGVAWDDVLADYMATNRLWQPPEDLFERLPEAVTSVLLRVHEDLLVLAFDTIRADHGTVDAYLEARLGLDAPARERLRAALVA
jgi:protein-tyrosine phosphatase